MPTELIIFDFDGVVADSEYLACKVAADFATELGFPLTVHQGMEKFIGKRASDVAKIIADGGGQLTPEFEQQLINRTIKTFDKELKPIEGVEEFLKKNRDKKICIASSSSHVRINASLNKMRLKEWFTGRIFSVDDVSRGKPFPDIFLHASRAMDSQPQKSLVIEDSITGVRAGVAASMRVVGLLAGSHIHAGYGKELIDAGACVVVDTYSELHDLMNEI